VYYFNVNILNEEVNEPIHYNNKRLALLAHSFVIALNLIYENKEEVYDTWTFALPFNKKLWEKK
jgi:hypothetical protein